jgi:hypothetical protein
MVLQEVRSGCRAVVAAVYFFSFGCSVHARCLIISAHTLLSFLGVDYIFRNYKNGYVWNDLSENDVIYPSDGVVYVLKGSEIFPGCSSGIALSQHRLFFLSRCSFTRSTVKVQNGIGLCTKHIFYLTV